MLMMCGDMEEASANNLRRTIQRTIWKEGDRDMLAAMQVASGFC